MMLSPLNTLDVIPAKAGIHPEIDAQPQGGSVTPHDLAACGDISGWTPAFAGVTPWLWGAGK